MAKNFKYLDDLIQNNSEIVLEDDILIDDDEKSEYMEGIEIKDKYITIDGANHTISARGKTRIFNNEKAIIVLKNCILRSGGSMKNGGAIFNEGKLKLIDCEVTNCISAGFMGGGAIFNTHKGYLYIVQTKFMANTVFDDNGGGGAISNLGELKIEKSIFSENAAFGSFGGGAIYNESEMNITDSKFMHNESEYGGGAILTRGNKHKIKNCDFEYNKPENIEHEKD